MQHVVSIPIIQHNQHTINEMFLRLLNSEKLEKEEKVHVVDQNTSAQEFRHSMVTRQSYGCDMQLRYFSLIIIWITQYITLWITRHSHMDVTCSLGSNKELNNYSSVHGVSIIHHLRKGNKTSYEDGLVRVANIFKR